MERNICFFLKKNSLKGIKQLLCDMASDQLILLSIIAESSWKWEMLLIWKKNYFVHLIKKKLAT